MVEILHHTRNPGIMIPQKIPTNYGFNRGFSGGANGFRNHPVLRWPLWGCLLRLTYVSRTPGASLDSSRRARVWPTGIYLYPPLLADKVVVVGSGVGCRALSSLDGLQLKPAGSLCLGGANAFHSRQNRQKKGALVKLSNNNLIIIVIIQIIVLLINLLLKIIVIRPAPEVCLRPEPTPRHKNPKPKPEKRTDT